jgi:chromosome segregation protein
MPDIYGLILETLRRHLGTRAEAVLEEGLKRLGKRQEELSPKDGETLLKGLAFRELQARLPAKEAKRVVEEALKKLSAPSEPADLEALEAGLKRFGLYLDWPEVARYRALVNRLRQDPDPRLMREAKALLEALEEKLEEALLRQAKDLAHLEESLERVRHLGGPKVRRLEKLVETVREAQKEGLLAQAEVERARSLALELRKLLESSVARPPTLPEIVFETQEEPPEDVFLTVEEAEELEGELIVDLEALPEEAARRLEALEVEEEGRRLEELLARHAHLLQEPTVSPLLAEVQALLEAGKPAGEKLSLLEAALKEAEANLRAEKKARLIQLEARLRTLPLPEEAKASLEAAFALAEETLREGGLPDLKPLEGELARLEAEARRQEEEMEALARELAAKGEAFAPLLEELRAVPLEALPQRLPEIKARYAALLMTQGEEAALKAKLKEAEEELKALRPEALALGLWESLEKAEEALAKGELPDLAALRREVAQAREAARQEALEELSRMEALAERFLGFGGEGVLRLIAEEKAKPLPDPTPVARALQALKRRLEAKREEVLTRLTALFQAYGGLEGFQSETHRRLRPLLQFLQSAKERLPRLGPKGLAQVEKTLAEAESLLEELKREAEAAKSILKEIQGADLEALLGVFEEKPPLDLDRFRLPGVEALGFLEESPPLPKEALQELKRALEPLRGLFQEEGPVALLLGQKALVLAPFSGRTLVALMEPGALSAFLLKLSS